MSTPPSLPHAPTLSKSIEDDYAKLLHRHRNNVANKSSEARPNKGQYGWGNLPADLINRILTMVKDTVVLDHVVCLRPQVAPIAEAVLHRQMLCSMRLVSNGWKAAIDSHPFWAQYLKLIRTDMVVTESTIMGTTPFEAAHDLTYIVCTPCNLFNTPGHLQAARIDCRTTTAKLGELQTCPQHESSFCTNCLRYGYAEELRLFHSETDDRDERGYVRPRHGLVCRHCRDAAFTVALQQELARCARGGPLYGLNAPWTSTACYQTYTELGVGTAQLMASHAVEDMFLQFNTRWNERFIAAHKLQQLLLLFRITFFKNRTMPPPGPEHFHFDNHVAALWDDDFAEDDRPDMRSVYAGWMKEIASGRYTVEDAARDEWRLQVRSNYLSPMVRERLLDASISTWANERFYYGFWVMPSDEVEQLCSPERDIHSEFRDMVENASRTVPNSPDAYPPTSVISRQPGRFHAPGLFNGVDRGHFLPPQSLLDLFNEQFTAVLQRRLEIPMGEVIASCRLLSRPLLEEHFADIGLRGLIELLKRGDMWIEGQYTQLAKQHVPSDAGGSTVVSEEGTQPGSPRIEAVNDEAPTDIRFVVREGWSSTTEDDAPDEGELEEDEYEVFGPSSPQSVAPETEGALGKRKQSEEEDEVNAEDTRVPLRPRLGSGQTSNSSSGETVNTALVTPDDSPDLMASAIQLAVDEDPSMGSMNDEVAAPAPRNNPAPTSPSSSLGKRKLSEEADSASERPARRRESRSGTSSPKEENQDEVDDKTTESDITSEVDKSAERDSASVNNKAAESDVTPTKAETQPQDAVAPSAPSPTPAPQEPPMDESEDLTESVTVSSRSSVGPKPEARKPLEEIRRDSTSDSEFDDSDSEFDLEDIEYGAPYVPDQSMKLGPRAEGAIMALWWNVRAPLRECHCTVCLRAKSEDMTRLLLTSTWENAVLRIA